MANVTTRNQYDPSSFASGKHLQDGGDFAALFNATQSVNSVGPLVAFATGGQAKATPLVYGMNQVDTVGTANDSVQLPPAIPGKTVKVLNNGANSMQVFGVPSNFQNNGAGDTIAVQGSTAQVATGTGVAQAVGVEVTYTCYRLGQWKQSALT